MACENCSRLERMLFQLIAPGDTLQTLQPLLNARGIPITPEVAAYIDRMVQPGQERIAMGAVKQKRKATAASKRYGKAFKKLAPQFKLKSGSWKVNGFRNAVRAAHKLAKSNRKL